MTEKLFWTDKRCKQYAMLEQLLIEASAINRGGGVIRRMTRCIELADKLAGTDWATLEQPFMGFLRELAIADRIERGVIEQKPTSAV